MSRIVIQSNLIRKTQKNCLSAQNQTAKRSNEKQWTVLGHETSFEMNRMYSLSKTFWKQKIGFLGNLDHLGKSLLSNAFNRDNLPRKQTYNVFMSLVV